MATRLKTPLSARLGIDIPVFQAPMASVTTAALAAAVSRAGGLGGFGCAYMQPEGMKKEIAAFRALTDRPFQLNFFVAPQPPAVPADSQGQAIAALAGYYKELGLPAPAPVAPPYAPELNAQLDLALELRPAAVTFHLNEMPQQRIRQFQAAGILVGGSATCVAEARRLAELGVDFIVAQGGEAGGHRGTWARDPQHALTGTLALVRMLVRAVKVPIVAAGGIMDGAGIAAVLSLGAQIAQIGTAFIPCPESGATEAYRAALLAATEDDTQLTDRFTAKPARGLRNRFIRESARADFPMLPFPAQSQLTSKLRSAAGQAGTQDFIALWAGQAVPLSRRMPAADLLKTLEQEALETIERVAGLRQSA